MDEEDCGSPVDVQVEDEEQTSLDEEFAVWPQEKLQNIKQTGKIPVASHCFSFVLVENLNQEFDHLNLLRGGVETYFHMLDNLCKEFVTQHLCLVALSGVSFNNEVVEV